MRSSHTKHFELHPPVAIEWARSRSIRSLFQKTFENWIDDHGPRLAAALAYYAVFSLAPLLMIAMAVAGATLGRQSAETALELRFYGLVGKTGAQVIEGILRDAHRPGMGSLTGLIGSILLLLGASAIFSELQDAFNTIWQTETRGGSLWKVAVDRFFSFGLVIIVETLLIFSVLYTTLKIAFFQRMSPEFLSLATSLRFLGDLLSLAVTTLLFALMFKLLPKTRVRWADVWPAALATAILFNLGKLLVALYLRKSSLISAYGAANSLVAVVGWMYYSAMVLYFGAEGSKVYTEMYGSRSAR